MVKYSGFYCLFNNDKMLKILSNVIIYNLLVIIIILFFLRVISFMFKFIYLYR